MPDWDPKLYEQFAAERLRPFQDLLHRVGHPDATDILDLGCGTGQTSRLLAEKFTRARVVGVDASPAMLEEARRRHASNRLTFLQGDVREWEPDGPVDIVAANAVLHWIPNPKQILARIANWVEADGVLAFQVPTNRDSAASRLIREHAAREPWRKRLEGVPTGRHVRPLKEYIRILEDVGFEIDAWETTYVHRLAGDDAVLQWLRATAFRPYVAALGDEAEDWVAELAARLRAEYRERNGRVTFPFRRRFVVAHRIDP